MTSMIKVGEYVGARTGVKVTKYLKDSKFMKSVELPETHPWRRYGITDIVMRKQNGVGKEIDIFDKDCNIIASSSDFKDGILGLKKYIYKLQVFIGSNFPLVDPRSLKFFLTQK